MRPKLKLMGRKTSSTPKKKKLEKLTEREADALILWLTEKIMMETTIHSISNTESDYVFKGDW